MGYVECHRICKSFRESGRFGTEVSVLQDLSLVIPSGQFVSIVGPNGCGKTTLLYIIGNMLKPDSGTVTLIDSAKKKNAKIGFVFQDYRSTLFPWRRNIDNIAFPLEIAGWSAKQRKEHVKAFLSELNIDVPLEGFPYELSGGYQQMVAIPRALIPEPDLLILDETFSALDCLTRLRMQQKLQDIWLKRPVTTIFVTHDIDEAIFLADRVVVLSPKPAQIVSELEVRLPRPRDINARVSDHFVALRAEVLRLLEGDKRP